MNKCISILGSTGSIGTQALEVAEAHQISIHALAAGSNIELLEKQVRKYRPKLVCIYNEKCFPILKERLNDLPVTILWPSGENGNLLSGGERQRLCIADSTCTCIYRYPEATPA